MSRKIIGITVGTQLPKPNFDQTDPTKGDYIRGDRSFITVDETLTQTGRPADSKATGDALADKVDKVEGKGLSTNDYTTEDKEKVAKIPTESEEAELVSFVEYTEAEIQSLWDSVSV